MLHTIPAAEAFTVAQLDELDFEGPEHTTTGVVCADCTKHYNSFAEVRAQVRHATVEHVRYCYALKFELAAEAKAEREAELRNERWFEERGGAEDDPRERALWALEDARRGL